uniref:1-aminocyclopropane-1-carboxylate synthase n=1 Tax=Cucumis melo TaxID=3656 RepID=A0A9I9DWE6_CUCME
MEQAKTLNLRVKGIMITNPSNPLDTTLSQREHNSVVDFATTNAIHIVSDEIYSLQFFSTQNFETSWTRTHKNSQFGTKSTWCTTYPQI